MSAHQLVAPPREDALSTSTAMGAPAAGRPSGPLGAWGRPPNSTAGIECGTILARFVRNPAARPKEASRAAWGEPDRTALELVTLAVFLDWPTTWRATPRRPVLSCIDSARYVVAPILCIAAATPPNFVCPNVAPEGPVWTIPVTCPLNSRSS